MANVERVAAPPAGQPVETYTTLARPELSFYQRNDALILGAAAVLVLLSLWELAWSSGLIDPLFMSGPSKIGERLVRSLNEGTLVPHLQFSLTNFATGFTLATLCAIPIGIGLGWYRFPRLLLEPFISGFYATPRIAFIPLIIMWFGIGLGSKVFIVFLSAFFPILINTMAGVRTTDPQLLRAARAFCANEWDLFRTIVMPSTVPFIIAGLRQGVAHGLIGMVVGEFFAGSKGIGYMIGEAGVMFETDLLFVGVLIIATAGISLSIVLQRVEKYFFRWRPQR